MVFQVVRNEANIRTFQSQIEEHEDRIQALREHRKNVMQELNQVQGLYEARKQDHITEDHLGQIGNSPSCCTTIIMYSVPEVHFKSGYVHMYM